MAQRVNMDWILFWTILGMVCLGLVMVYSASSVVQELKANAPVDAVLDPDGPDPIPRQTGFLSPRRIGAAAIGIAVLAAICMGLYRSLIPVSWGIPGALAAVLLQVLAYWMEVDRTPHYAFLVRQAGAALVGFFAMMVLSQRDYRHLCSPQWAFAGLASVLFLLIVVYFADEDKHRWLNVGISIQPAEFAKPALIVFLAWFVTQRAGTINRPRTVWSAGLALTALAGAVVVPDFGTAIVLVATAAALFYLAGLNWRYTAAAAIIGMVLLGGAILFKPYRLKRCIDYFDPKYKILVYVDPGKRLLNYAESGTSIKDTRYHALQAKIAVGAGGATGRGLMQSRQKLLFLPEAHNDYIFAIIAEELGLPGSLFVLLVFAIILWRGYRLYWTAPDEFGKYLAAGVTTAIVFQALLNMSVVLDLGPTKGIPLPLVSFGGSSLLSTMICLGLLLSVSQRSSAA